MSSKKQTERKKKKREEIAKKRVLARREQIRKQRKKEVEDKLRYEAEYELKNGRPTPFIKNEELKKKQEELVLKKIERNNEILKELEKQIIKDKNKKKKKKVKNKKNSYRKLPIKERIKLAKEKNQDVILYPGDTITSFDLQ